MPANPGLAAAIAGWTIIASAGGACAQQTEQLSLPNVTVTAPAAPAAAPYLRDPGKAYQRNPYSGSANGFMSARMQLWAWEGIR